MKLINWYKGSRVESVTGAVGVSVVRTIRYRCSAVAMMPVLNYATLAVIVGSLALSLAAPSVNTSPAVSLDQGTFTGVSDGVTNRFLGIPFAKPPCAFSI